MTDILLVSGLELSDQGAVMPQVGQMILEKILAPHHAVKRVDFDAMASRGEFSYTRSYDDNIARMAAYLVETGSPVMGFYTICNNFLTVLSLSEEVHRLAPEVRIFFGGPHATETWKSCIESLEYLTAVCMGESEYSILPLTEALLRGENPEQVPGVAWRDGEGRARCNPACPLVPQEELHRYAVYEMDRTFDPETATMFIEGGRGCPFHCSFCSTSLFWHRRFRVKPVKDLILEMDELHRRSGFRHFSIEHDMFTANRKHLTEFCRILTERGSPYGWGCSSRIDVLDEEIIRMMAKAGCETVFLGIETGSPRMQKLIEKNLKLEEAIPKVILMQQLGIMVKASFIYGLVDEREEDFLQTLEMLQKLYLSGVKDTQLHRFFLLPATPDAEKVRGRVYFDENDIDISIAPRRAMTEKNREKILRYPELFLQYYTFESEVRRRYRWADALTVFTSNLAIHFPHTCDMLLERLGYLGLYRKYEETFRQLNMIFSLEGPLPMRNAVPGMLEEIVEAEGAPELAEMYRYEKALRDYIVNGETEMRTVECGMDIPAALERKEYRMEPYRAALALDPKEKKVRIITMPSWLEVD